MTTPQPTSVPSELPHSSEAKETLEEHDKHCGCGEQVSPQPLLWKTTSAKTPPSLPLLWKKLEGKHRCRRPYCSHMQPSICEKEYREISVQTAVNECVEDAEQELVETCQTYLEDWEIQIILEIYRKRFGRSG